MKETLIQIADNICQAEPAYRKSQIPVVARIHGTFDEEEDIYWFVVGSWNKGMLSYPHLKQYGQIVPRNSNIATQILNSEIGKDIRYSAANIVKKLIDHHIKADSKADLTNKKIFIEGDSQIYAYDDIEQFLKTLRENQARIEENKREIEQLEELRKQEIEAHKRGIITKGLNKKLEERRILTLQQEEMNQLTRFIRQQGKLRFNPILDPIQNRIKTRDLFNGVSIVIDGGPGTGKTTTMIQRLKYLTDWNAIEEDFLEETNRYNLTPSQRDHLHQAIDNHRDWIFFSPSELLKEYLSDAMNREGLSNTNAKVWNWDGFRNKIIREYYLLIDPTNDNAPFKASRSHEKLFNDGAVIIEKFKLFFLNQLRVINSRFPKIDTEGTRYKWLSIALAIKKRFEGSEDFSLLQFVQLFNTLERLYREDCKELLAENRENVKSIADEIFVLSKEDAGLYEKLTTIAGIQSIEQNEDEQDEQTAEGDNEVLNEDLGNIILPVIRSWYKRYCYSKKNSDVRLSVRQEQLSKLLLPILTEKHKNQIDRVGELALFEQFAKYTHGIISNVFGGFATKYKRFRRQALANKEEAWNLVELEVLLKRREGKELHPQEQALLIGFINNLVKLVLRVNQQSLNHQFITAYKDLARPIIGIDEATDFNECEIYAMQSLLYNDYNSLTICGDLMQRLTKTGITSWDNIRPYVEGMNIVEMKTSYRQSSSLLKVAKEMYEDTIGEEPSYKAYMKSTKVPAPLAFVSTSNKDKISWIEQRIKEVYTAYGKRLPSIAIFLNNKEEIRSFVEKLRDTDFVIDSGIEIVDGSDGNVLSSSNNIRVYPIDVVKGMEFDVVFFHNIDQSNVGSELIKRYIYVGVSRAAFFLGITLNADNKEITKYFTLNSNWSKV